MKTQQYSLAALLSISVAVGGQGINDVSARSQTAADTVRITVIGCVRSTQPTASGSVGTIARPTGDTKYLLSNLTLVPPESRTAAADAGSAATILAEAVTVYRLDDSADSLIAPHVGDRVRVTGAVVPTPPSPTGTIGRNEPLPIEAVRAPMLRVESMQKISSDSAVCSQ